MHTQYLNFIKQFPDKLEEEDQKKLEQEVVRKRIDNALPAHLRTSSNQFKQRPPPGFLADKHTYSTMRKIYNMKSRKLFIFDSYTAKQKAENAMAADAKDSQQNVAANSARTTKESKSILKQESGP